MSFWGELRRRNVFKVGAAYLIVAWLLIQVAGQVFPQLQLPSWAPTLVTVLLIIGFPVALVLAWAYELTPEGIKAASDAPLAGGTAATRGRKLNIVVTGLLVLALGFIVVDRFVLDGSGTTATAAGPPRLAVLPCENQSPDASDAYFATQMHEEIVQQLGKLSGLRVISRSSVMQYAAGPARPAVSRIAADLNAAAIMECSVRFAGTEIRVTANLIDPETDEQLWGNAYPGDIGNVRAIFAMQADIATNIANALDTEFSPAEQQRVGKTSTESAEAYTLFLEARELNNRSRTDFENVLDRLDRALALDPQFAEALGYRAWLRAYGLVNATVPTFSDPAAREAWRREVETDADRALALDETVGHAWAARGAIAMIAYRWSSADEAYARAVALSPSRPEVLLDYAYLKAARGEVAEAERLRERGVEVAPRDLTTYVYVLNIAFLTNDRDTGLRAADAIIELSPSYGPARALRGLLNRDRPAEAETDVRAAEALITASAGQHVYLPGLAMTYKRLGLADDAQRVRDRYLALADPGAIGIEQVNLSIAVDDIDGALAALRTSRERIERGEIDPGFFPLTILVTDARNGADPLLAALPFRPELERIYEVAMSR
jgi:TolB-like protein